MIEVCLNDDIIVWSTIRDTTEVKVRRLFSASLYPENKQKAKRFTIIRKFTINVYTCHL